MITLRRAAAEMIGKDVQVSITTGLTLGPVRLVDVGEDCLRLFGSQGGRLVSLAHVVSMQVIRTTPKEDS